MTPEEIKEYDSIRAAGKVFHTSAVFLQDMSPIIKSLAKERMPIDLNANIITSVFIYALSAEIALKALIFKEGAQVPRQHDLKSLFSALSLGTQKTIKDKLRVKYPDFDTCLEENKNSFVEWRYFYEQGNATVNIAFLRDFSNTLNCICSPIQ